jgi:hypothetical protein
MLPIDCVYMFRVIFYVIAVKWPVFVVSYMRKEFIDIKLLFILTTLTGMFFFGGGVLLLR